MNIYCDFKPGKDSCVDTVLLELHVSNVCRKNWEINTLLTYYAEIKKSDFKIIYILLTVTAAVTVHTKVKIL